MTRNVTLATGEALALDDSTPAIALHSPESPTWGGGYGFAPWCWQGFTFGLSPRQNPGTYSTRDGELTGFQHTSTMTEADASALRSVIAAHAERARPATNGPAWHMVGSNCEGVKVAHSQPLAPLSDVAARSHVLVWLEGADVPSWGDGAGFYPAVIARAPTLDVEAGELPRIAHLVASSRPLRHPWTRDPGVWWCSVPFRARLLTTLPPPDGDVFRWTPDDTAPGTVLLRPDGFKPTAR